jgi:hypothetical protein
MDVGREDVVVDRAVEQVSGGLDDLPRGEPLAVRPAAWSQILACWVNPSGRLALARLLGGVSSRSCERARWSQRSQAR